MTDDAPAASASALVAEAAAKSSLLWVRPEPGGRAWPAWHVWHEGSAYVVSGPGEQQLPPLLGPVEVVLRSKDTWARLLTVAAHASTVAPTDESWPQVTALLKNERLNAPDPDGLLDRWAAADTVTRLEPTAGLTEGPDSYDTGSGAAPPPGSPAVTVSWAPWHIRGRKGARRNRRAR